jgi:large subunit ribosomal protein L3
MAKGVFGRKLGMTQMFDEKTGDLIGVTAVKLGPCVVVRKKTVESDGYTALVVGFEAARAAEVDGETVYKVKKPTQGVFKKVDVAPMRYVRELRMNDAEMAKYEIGQSLDASAFKVGDRVDVAGTSKGRGYAGVMKRHGMAGGVASHGTHEFFRHGGSIGTNMTPGRVLKGKKMAGQMGNERVSVLNVRVLDIVAEDNVLLIKGTLPGAPGGEVLVRESVKGRR